MDGFRFPFDLRSLLALVALTWLASFAHEFTHHLVAACVCGTAGRMSLSLFVLGNGCDGNWQWATAAGPALSYALMWLGMWLVLQRRHLLWGYGLVIANKPFLRLITTLGGGGDEGVLWDLLSPQHGRWLASATVIALSLPPLWVCYRRLARRHRPWVFLGAMLLPMLPILPVPFADRAWYGAWIAGEQTLPAAFGVPWSVWGVEVAVLALLLSLAVASAQLSKRGSAVLR